MAEGLNLIFAGTPPFAARALQALIDSPHRIAAVYTQPDRPAGRGRKAQASAVKELALAHALPVEQPQRLRDQAVQAQLHRYRPEVMIVAAYGLLLPEAVLSIPVHGCLNIHASLLPRWRGAAPIQRAILAGDRETGVTIMQMDKGMDTGPMLLKKACAIDNRDTAQTLHDRLAELGATAIVEALAQLQGGGLHPQAQDERLASHAPKISKEEGRIDWRDPAYAIERRIRAFNPWPIAFTELGDKPVRIWEAETLDANADAEPGTISRVDPDWVCVACGEGQLCLLQAQLPGARAMPMSAILNGHGQLFQTGRRFS